MSVTGGIDWEDAFRPLQETSWFAALAYIVYIVFASLCVMNVIVGIFCHNATETFESDKERTIENHLINRKKYVKAWVELFHSIDTDGNLRVSTDEFSKGLED